MTQSVTIKAVAAVIRGVSFDKEDAHDAPGEGLLPILRAGNIEYTLNTEDDLIWVPAEDIASEQRMQVGDIAICMSSGSPRVIGKTATLRDPWEGSVGAFCAIIRPLPNKVLPEYLSHFLGSELFRSWTRQSAGANIKNIKKSELENFSFHLPSLEKQREVVDRLSRAASLVRLRREAENTAALIIPALFIHVFGNPEANPKAWNETTLGGVVKEFRYGTSQKSGPSGWPALRIPNVVSDRLNLNDMKHVDVPTAELDRLRLVEGDLLFVRTNGNPDYVGRSAVYSGKVMADAGFDPENCIYASYLIRARLDLSVVNPTFLQVFMASVEGRRRLREQAKTSAGQYNINVEGLSAIRVPVPPIDKQQAFEEQCRAFDGVTALQAEAHIKVSAIYSAILAEEFVGGKLNGHTEENVNEAVA